MSGSAAWPPAQSHGSVLVSDADPPDARPAQTAYVRRYIEEIVDASVRVLQCDHTRGGS